MDTDTESESGAGVEPGVSEVVAQQHAAEDLAGSLYESEPFMHQESMRRTDFIDELLEYIDSISLTYRTKRVLKIIVRESLSESNLLSNLSQSSRGGLGVYGVVDSRIDFRATIISSIIEVMKPSDLRNVNTVLNVLERHVNHLMTRAIGDRRERELQMKIGVESQHTSRLEATGEKSGGLLGWRRR